jgi:peroxiredoxin
MTRIRPTHTVRGLVRALAEHLPLVVLAFSITVNLVLADRLLRAQRPERHSLAAGTKVEPFEATSPQGLAMRVDYDGSMPTVLYHFSPSCTWCERNWDNVRAFVLQSHDRYRFVGISTTAVTTAFMQARHLDFDVATNVAADVARRYALGGTPQTIVVSADGRILKVWAGVYAGRQAQQVETYFGLRLPGLQPLAAITQHP